MDITVGLRVTGIYFGSPLSNFGLVKVTVPASPTVKQVMDAAVTLVKGGGVTGASLFSFSPMKPSPGEDLHSVSVLYTTPPLKPGALPPGMTTPAAGLYVLNDSLDSPYEKSLQYYHYRPTKVGGKDALIQLNINSKFLPFTDPPAEPIEDGDEIVWRCVIIENAPVPSIRAYGTALRAAEQTSDAVL